jgi:hypothetical protein
MYEDGDWELGWQTARERAIYLEEKLPYDTYRTHIACQTPGCLKRDQLILVNKAVNEKEQLEKGLEEEEGLKP